MSPAHPQEPLPGCQLSALCCLHSICGISTACWRGVCLQRSSHPTPVRPGAQQNLTPCARRGVICARNRPKSFLVATSRGRNNCSPFYKGRSPGSTASNCGLGLECMGLAVLAPKLLVSCPSTCGSAPCCGMSVSCFSGTLILGCLCSSPCLCPGLVPIVN